PGMVLARNLTANNGMLLLNAGKVLNLALIEKLIAFDRFDARLSALRRGGFPSAGRHPASDWAIRPRVSIAFSCRALHGCP
ncbi:hypothetical protein LDY98_28160, partial [Pseudomonas aeruginosa]|nr:hypothetical protein [Pseudomonas aeruginosa]